MKLNIGCGFDIKKGWVNCDREKAKGVNVVWDLTKHPLPFSDNSIDEILASGIFEHILDWESLLKECHRILKSSGIITIIVPYGMDYRAYHIRFFKESIMEGFYGTTKKGYEGCLQYSYETPPFELVNLKIERIFRFGWHLHHYLKIKYWIVTDPRTDNKVGKRYTFPIGKKMQITWVLKKV